MAELGKPMRMSETWEKNSDPNYHVLAWMAAKGPPEPESYLDRVRAEKRSEEPAEIIAHYAHDVRKSILMKNPYLRMSYRAPDDPVVKKPMPDVFLGKIKSDVTQGFAVTFRGGDHAGSGVYLSMRADGTTRNAGARNTNGPAAANFQQKVMVGVGTRGSSDTIAQDSQQRFKAWIRTINVAKGGY